MILDNEITCPKETQSENERSRIALFPFPSQEGFMLIPGRSQFQVGWVWLFGFILSLFTASRACSCRQGERVERTLSSSIMEIRFQLAQ